MRPLTETRVAAAAAGAAEAIAATEEEGRERRERMSGDDDIDVDVDVGFAAARLLGLAATAAADDLAADRWVSLLLTTMKLVLLPRLHVQPRMSSEKKKTKREDRERELFDERKKIGRKNGFIAAHFSRQVDFEKKTCLLQPAPRAPGAPSALPPRNPAPLSLPKRSEAGEKGALSMARGACQVWTTQMLSKRID